MGTSAVAPRSNLTQQVNYFRAAVSYNTPLIGTDGKVPLGTLPDGAIVVGLMVKVTQAFNAATTNVLTVGTAASNATVLAASDVDETVIDTTAAFVGYGYQASGDTPLFIVYTQTGTAASAGAATIILEYVPDNDR